MAGKTTSAKKSTSSRKTSSTPKASTTSKPQKPVFRLGTIITVVVLAALIGFAFYLNREKQATEAEATPTGAGISYAFDVEATNIKSIEVKPADGGAVKLIRNDASVWVLELPEQVDADQGLAESAASQAAALLIVSPIEGDPEIFGLDQPKYTITLGYADGSLHTLEVGDAAPTNNGYYTRVDKEKMLLVSLGAIDSLTNLLAFPPYLNTPTPTALPPTETPIPPTAEATVTPTP